MKKISIILAAAVTVASFTSQSLASEAAQAAAPVTSFINNTGYDLEYVEKDGTMETSFHISKDNKQNENNYQYVRGPYVSVQPGTITTINKFKKTFKPIDNTVYDISSTVQQTIKDWNKDNNNHAIITIGPDFKASLTWDPLEKSYDPKRGYFSGGNPATWSPTSKESHLSGNTSASWSPTK
jgi:hypothetical protein